MWTLRRIAVLAAVAVPVIATPWFIANMWEDLDAGHVMVIQAPWSGELTVVTTPGVSYQGFGTVTKYPLRATYSFAADEKDNDAKCKHIQFNDGGLATLCGSTQWEMPLGREDVIAIHKKFGSEAGVQASAVSRMLDGALFLSGPLMTSIESMAERKAELVQDINDQAENGVYVTKVVQREITDLAGAKREVAASEIVRDASGLPKRQQGSILSEFKIKLLPMTISKINYNDVVQKQIAARQAATTQVQIAQADAQRAVQEKLTTEAQGAANAAKAKWEQETIKAKFVTEAQQRLDVATLDAQAAEQYKRKQILEGEGDAKKQELILAANGALDQKLEAYKEVNAAYATAIQNAQPGAWSPVVSMSGGASGVANASQLIDLLTAKTAKDIGIDMAVPGRAATAKK